jgi:tetratricopeptide (TPR) repeat protein
MLRERWRDDPAIRDEALIYFGDFCAGIGEFDAAESVLRSVGTPAAEKYLARFMLQRERIDEAETIIRHVLSNARNDCAARLLLARILYAKKDYRHSLENVIFVLMHEPFNEEARQLLSLMKPTR